MKDKRNRDACPCGGASGHETYAQCCQPYIEGLAVATTAEHLMRSRYSAYALGKSDYLLNTWHTSTRPDELLIAAAGTPHATRWLRLKIHSHTQLNDTQAQVMFTASYREGGRAYHLKEHSRFVQEQGRWFYVDGDVEFDES